MAAESESRTSREDLLRELFAEVLNRPQVGVDDGFFDLGGDSVVAMQLVARAREAGLEISRREVFLLQSVAELAAVARDVPPAGTDGPRSDAPQSDGAAPADRHDRPLVPLSPTELDDIARQLK
ncbi:phosphopantetheine-binding protein [Kitasatospora sp. NPDC059577]|uniref:phosphopantetheine-binding protein n=1 Tax=unclassified Kitasatospora TaxID=2633591 RepID=UPI0036B35AC3